ncbi:DNA polymerase I [Prochlorococcus sp. MIT 1300]|uniref:DNA polymerase I n=1 Tax=Prochlorococcus sp. MIT 1300 TaxID=3096218 RepID=UPI002A74A923|nr:DNA polymerase I [Prochlorococcus sp. MIT 1300]
MSTATEKPILLLVDGHSLAFRSFYAFSKGGEGGLSTKEGIPTSVTYGFLKSLLDNCISLKPQGITIAFDTAEPTFRHKADLNYKANRDVAPDIFFQDLEQLQKILKEELNLSICLAPGYEADDVLGTLANEASKDGWRVRILSGDRDLFQLVDDKKEIAVLYMGGGPYSKNKGPKLINEEGVLNKLGVEPKKVIDFKALTGDSSDNIPGVKGVGPKTAINLLNENGDLDGVYRALEAVEAKGEKATKSILKGALKTKLNSDRENAYLSRFLAEILLNVPIPKKPILKLQQVDSVQLKNTLEKLELNSLVNLLPKFVDTFSAKELKKDKVSIESKTLKKASSYTEVLKEKTLEGLPNENKIPELKPIVIDTTLALKKLVDTLLTFTDPLNPVSLDTETTSLNPFKAQLIGIGFCWGTGLEDLAYIPIGHIEEISASTTEKQIQLPLEQVLNAISPWLSSFKHPKVLQNAKYDRLILLQHGFILNGVVFDTLLADYLIDSSAKHSLEIMAKREFNFAPKSFSDIVSKGMTFANVTINEASLYCGMDVYVTRKLTTILKNYLEEMGPSLVSLLQEVEQPLEQVLADMETTGIRIDLSYLEDLSKELISKLKDIETRVYKLAGVNFNLSSPKQLGEVLFEQLKLDRKKSRRTKTGWSTDATVLERLENDHPIITLLIEHRTISKLLTTYVDALPALVEKETGRVHTDFNQAVTATGRLSSSNPNLQNIPVRTEFSRRIRKAFLPQQGWQLISADYSQIELRILAHLSNEKALKEAYQNGDDVHALTAKVLLEKDSITAEERRLGKTINFGVIYGMGAQRFARSTGLTIKQAKEFLNKFKDRYQMVFSFLELQEKLALSRGYVETLLGRRRKFNFDKNGLGRLKGIDPLEIDLEVARRAGMEAQQLRAAANAPIQGSSADIIKIAMVKLNKQLKNSELPAHLLLQVHDELVLEVQPESIEEVKALVVKTMQEAVELSVPLLVETGIGNNWMDAK